MKATIQIFTNDNWITAGEFNLPDSEINKGIEGGYFVYGTERMKICEVEDEVIEGVAGRCAEMAIDLRSTDSRG